VVHGYLGVFVHDSFCARSACMFFAFVRFFFINAVSNTGIYSLSLHDALPILLRFRGEAGHASAASALEASALHQAVRWGAGALALVEAESHRRFGGLTGLRFNIGRIEGGIKANVVAPEAELRFGFRPLPSHDIDELHAR